MEKGAIEQMVIGGIDLLVISSFALWHILAIGSHIKMHGFSYQAIGSHVKILWLDRSKGASIDCKPYSSDQLQKIN